jgi:DNA mismatch repair protein MutL
MSGKIIILPETLTHRIAAGEVIERPASIVKELLENSLDAGATEISVELVRGGTQSVRVTDNGEGIDPADVPLAFSRHATSKITQFDDLYRVHSFGFRGEALPSIASISHMEITTRRAEHDFGTKAVFETGEMKECIDTGCPAGTSVLVSNIFEPVPVRRKFLKSDMVEQGYCLDWITRLALARPEVRLRVSTGGRTALNIPVARDLSERIALTMGQDFRGQLILTSGEKNGSSLYGFVSRPEFTRSNAAQTYIYVNGRFVKDYFLNHAVMTAYRRIIEPRRYPMVVMFLTVPTADVDVNVHPTKMEVRFRSPREIYGLIVEALAAVIGVKFADRQEGPVKYENINAAYGSRVEDALKRYHISSGAGKLFFKPIVKFKEEQSSTQGDFSSSFLPTSVSSENDEDDKSGPGFVHAGSYFMSLRYLGQVAGTYLVFEGEDGLAVIDQHAAHERVLFERLRRQANEEKERGKGQRLLLPEVISLPPRELSFLFEAIPILADVGMEVEPFGRDSAVVKSMPSMISDTDARSLIADLLNECLQPGRDLPLIEKKDKIFASLACRAAIKATHTLNVAEVESLCRDLDSFPGISTCPHGRPIKVSFSKLELEKMFKRR